MAKALSQLARVPQVQELRTDDPPPSQGQPKSLLGQAIERADLDRLLPKSNQAAIARFEVVEKIIQRCKEKLRAPSLEKKVRLEMEAFAIASFKFIQSQRDDIVWRYLVISKVFLCSTNKTWKRDFAIKLAIEELELFYPDKPLDSALFAQAVEAKSDSIARRKGDKLWPLLASLVSFRGNIEGLKNNYYSWEKTGQIGRAHGAKRVSREGS